MRPKHNISETYALRDQLAQLAIACQRAGAYDLVCSYTPGENASQEELRQAIVKIEVALATRRAECDQTITTYTLPTD